MKTTKTGEAAILEIDPYRYLPPRASRPLGDMAAAPRIAVTGIVSQVLRDHPERITVVATPSGPYYRCAIWDLVRGQAVDDGRTVEQILLSTPETPGPMAIDAIAQLLLGLKARAGELREQLQQIEAIANYLGEARTR